jgi:DNA repair exonuclease SbcCD ATPase subunit
VQDAFAQVTASGQSAAQASVGLMQQLYELQGNVAASRKLTLDAMSPVDRDIQKQIYQLQDKKKVDDERTNLEQQLLELQGNTTELRKRELEKLDPANRELQQRIYALQDQQKAEEDAKRAAEESARAAEQAAQESARAAEQLKSAWKGLTDSIMNEVARIRGLDAQNDPTSLSRVQSQFAVKTAQARAGDQDAARLLPQLSQQLTTLAERNAVTSVELRRIHGMTANSLEETAKILAQKFGFQLPSYDVGSSFVPQDMDARIHHGERIFTKSENVELVAAVRSTGKDNGAIKDQLLILNAWLEKLFNTSDKSAANIKRMMDILVYNVGRTDGSTLGVKVIS